jgi:hypothetical protein
MGEHKRERLKLFLALPTYGNQRYNTIAIVRAVVGPTPFHEVFPEEQLGGMVGSGPLARCFEAVYPEERESSLLAHGFNMLWTHALARRRSHGITHFLMLHADVLPADADWVSQLHGEMERVGATILSAVIPMKGRRGLTSTALEGPPFRRLTMTEIMARPETFTDPGLLVNTGIAVGRHTGGLTGGDLFHDQGQHHEGRGWVISWGVSPRIGGSPARRACSASRCGRPGRCGCTTWARPRLPTGRRGARSRTTVRCWGGWGRLPSDGPRAVLGRVGSGGTPGCGPRGTRGRLRGARGGRRSGGDVATSPLASSRPAASRANRARCSLAGVVDGGDHRTLCPGSLITKSATSSQRPSFHSRGRAKTM